MEKFIKLEVGDFRMSINTENWKVWCLATINSKGNNFLKEYDDKNIMIENKTKREYILIEGEKIYLPKNYKEAQNETKNTN